MKQLIRKWLGINDDVFQFESDIEAISTRILGIQDEMEINSESTVKQDSVKELLITLVKHLKLVPKSEYFNEIEKAPTYITKRRFWLEEEKAKSN